MAKRVREEKTNLIEKSGYIIYNTVNGCYYDEDVYEQEDFNLAFIYNTIEEASEAIEETMDYPSEYEIHKVKTIFVTEQVLVRKVTYEQKEGEE